MAQPPSTRYATWFSISALSRAPILLILSLGSAGLFYGVIPRADLINPVLSLALSIGLWALTMGAACHAVLWEKRPSLRECLEVSLRALGPNSGLASICLIAIFIGFSFLILPGLAVMVALSLVIPMMMRERPSFMTALKESPRLILRYWSAALPMVGFGIATLIITTLIALFASGMLGEGETSNEPIFDALIFGFWSVASAVLGSVCLLAIREVDEAGTRH